MRLSKTTNYAIRILIDCATADGNLVKVADISERREITLQNTFKIVHLLSRAGFVEAVRGRHGGVRLAKPAAEIRIGDVVRAIETLQIEADAVRGEEGPPANLDELFDSALEAFITVLDGHTLEEMAAASSKGTRVAKRRGPRNLAAEHREPAASVKVTSNKVNPRTRRKKLAQRPPI